MAEDEPDIHNFSTSSSHRLPTITGTQALQNELSRARGISTGLPSLDHLLGSCAGPSPTSGIRRGHVTEIYGPPGVGKTTVGMQLTVNTIQSSESDARAIWITTGKPLVRGRLNSINDGSEISELEEPPSSPPQRGRRREILADKFHYIETLSLLHLLVLLVHPTSIFPPPGTSIIVVDDLSNLINGSFPRPPRSKLSSTVSPRDKPAQKASMRRFQVIENLASALTRLAASQHIAIVVLNSASTSLKDGQRALLKPALSGQAWDVAVDTRIVLYRDFYPPAQRHNLTTRERNGYRIAAIVRLGGRDVFRRAIPFVIEESGLRQLPIEVPEDDLDANREDLGGQILPPTEFPREPPALPALSSPFPSSQQPFQRASQLPLADGGDTRPTKRKADEIADSEDEDEVDEKDDKQAQDLSSQSQRSDMRAKEQDEILFDTHTQSLADNNLAPRITQ